jgi:peptidoglycan-N-acetylglucosamine deacetylase
MRQDHKPTLTLNWRLILEVSSLCALALALAVVLMLTAGEKVQAHSHQHLRSLARVSGQHDRGPRVLYHVVGCRPRSLGRAYSRAPGSKVVALTFDDGPSTFTSEFVRMLRAPRVTATFFLIGRQISAGYWPLLRAELRDGDALGDHTYSHPNLLLSGDRTAQLLSTIGAIRAATGYRPCVFRPPYGAYDAAVLRAAASLGLATIMWDVDPRDWALPGSAAIQARVLAQVRPGSIVLSHDGGGPRGQTLAAYSAIITTLRARGYRFLTVPQLLGFRPIYRPCLRLCDGTGVARVPRGAIVQPG